MSPLSVAYNSHEPFDDQFAKYVEHFLNQLIQPLNRTSRIIVLDDGGFLILALQRRRLRAQILAVEQTTSGYNKLKDISLHFPIINVARSVTKLQQESPYIAKAIHQQLCLSVARYNSRANQVLIIGSGAIGSALKERLKHVFTVQMHDVNHPDSPDYSWADVIVGATGSQVIGPEEYPQLKPHVILASASSSDREFSAWERRRSLPVSDCCHDDICDRGVVLLNGGFPINFTGRDELEPVEDIQLTRALLFVGLCEVMEQKLPPGLRALSSSSQSLCNISSPYFAVLTVDKVSLVS